MKKTVCILNIVLLSFTLISCGLFRLRSKPKELTYLYDGEDTGLNELILTEGVFTSNDPNRYAQYIVFFNDGLICSPNVLPTKDSITLTYPKKRTDKHMWGTYIVEDSIIKTQTIVDLGLDGGIGVSLKFFKILDAKHIKWIGYISDHGEYFERNIIYSYEPLANRMDSADCWLLKKKWFWTKEAWERRNK